MIKINIHSQLDQWLNENYGFENGYIKELSHLKDSKNQMQIGIGY